LQPAARAQQLVKVMLQNAIIAQNGSANFLVDVSIDACSHIAIIPLSGKKRDGACVGAACCRQCHPA
jgi:hypothetical protein